MLDIRRRVFVVGEHGQMAQALGRESARRGHVVSLSGRATTDVTDRTTLAAVVADFRADLVINAAAYTAVDKAEDEPDATHRINCDGAVNVAVAAGAAGAPLIHMSTDYVYDGRKPGPYVETDAVAPLGAYGASKLAGETAIAALGGHPVILRTSWLYSADGSNFVKTMLRLAGQRDEIGVVDDQWGAPTFAADLAGAILSIGEVLLSSGNRASLGGVYHAAGGGETTWCRFARAIMKTSAERGGPSCRVRAIATSDYPVRARRPANSRLDCTKLERTFGIRLPPWQSSLDACLDELLATAQRVPT
jgi:dTDP-4-dehydrorhamnose reductase